MRAATNPDVSGRRLTPSTVTDVAGMPKGIVVADDFDWQGDRPLNRPLRLSVIYETHVRGSPVIPPLTSSTPARIAASSSASPTSRSSGMTALELLPVQEFDEPRKRARESAHRRAAPELLGLRHAFLLRAQGTLRERRLLGQQVTEFKEMVRALHAAGIEVILDIVFNHSAEGDATGPRSAFADGTIPSTTCSTRRIPRIYRDFTGCGNTMNCNHPILRTLIIDCLRYWVVEMHVDGFRFDLGSVLGRDTEGGIMENPPILERIAEEPVLRHTKIIAEAWDAAGAYQVGWFPGGTMGGMERPVPRRRAPVLAGRRGTWFPHLATRLAGSSDLYLRDGRKPFHSINFLTSHDGFTLNDLVSYARKHNEENGEAIATAPRRTSRPTTASKGRPTIPGSRRSETAGEEPPRHSPPVPGHAPCSSGATSFGAPSGEQQRLVPEQQTSWYDWGLVEGARRHPSLLLAR